MPPSRKKTSAPPDEDLLTPAVSKPLPPVRPANSDAPAILDFKTEFGEPWRVERFDALVAEFHLSPNLNADEESWHTTVKQFVVFARDHVRQWLVVRRVFGIAPLIPGPNVSQDDLRVWTRAELLAEGFEAGAELDALRALWNSHTQRETNAHQPAVQSTMSAPKGELPLDDTLLEQFHFPERIFKITCWDPVEKKDLPRSDTDNRREREWFIQRVAEWSKMLVNSVGGPIARDALMNEMYLRRLESDIATAPSKDQDKLHERKDKLSRSYSESVERLQGMFPEMNVAGQVSFRAVISDLVAAHRDYYAYADRRLVDKVMTTAEIEFGLRSSQQIAARHRFTLNIAIAECIHNFYNPDFKTQFKPAVWKKIEAGHRAAVLAAQEASHEPVVDLEKGVEPGTGDEFEDYHDARCPECDAPISSSAKKCPNCGMENPNDKPKEEYV